MPEGLAAPVRSYLIACRVEGKSPKTLSVYTADLSRFCRFLRDNGLPSEVANITADDVRLYLLSLQQSGLAAVSVSRYYRSLKTFFNWLVDQDVVAGNPMAKIKPPKVESTVIRPFSRRDLEHLMLATSGKRFRDIRNRAMLLLFLDTGLRLEELAAIQINDIDIDSRVVTVMGKGRKERRVRFGHTTMKALLRYVLARKDKHSCLWVTKSFTPMAKHSVQTMMVRLSKWAGVTGAKWGPHTYRHTAAIAFLMNSRDPLALQTMLGHESMEMTRRYTRALAEQHMLDVHEKASPVDNLKLK